jgi:hypothetical protein
VEMGTLELISSRKCPIRSLRLNHYGTTEPFSISRFQNLNLGELQGLYFDLPSDYSREIIDLALQSKCKDMILETYYDSYSLELFKHKLLQQVDEVKLYDC